MMGPRLPARFMLQERTAHQVPNWEGSNHCGGSREIEEPMLKTVKNRIKNRADEMTPASPLSGEKQSSAPTHDVFRIKHLHEHRWIIVGIILLVIICHKSI